MGSIKSSISEELEVYLQPWVVLEHLAYFYRMIKCEWIWSVTSITAKHRPVAN